ncbi:MAG TPA: CvpA family protein [Candidatus Scybalousia intestinigallinarum]|nr:CvpA family protein [Candidatus Scybalousia intestinigallinarum]
MNIVDALIILFIALMGVIGFKRGVVKQTVSTVGLIIVLILAFQLKNPLAEFLSLHLPFFDFFGVFEGVTALNIILYQLISFLVIFALLEIVLRILISITGVIEKIFKYTIILGIPSKILGLLVGLIEGFIFTFIVLFFLKQPVFNIKEFESSTLTPKILESTPVLSGFASDLVETFNDVYLLGKEYSISDPNTLNRETVDVMLKHGVISTDYVVKLIDADKIEIDGIDSVLNKYR